MVLDGTTEHGDGFMSTRSYLPNEIHWGFTFAPIISCARGASTRHEVDIGRCSPLLPWPGQTPGMHVAHSAPLLPASCTSSTAVSWQSTLL